MNKEIDWIEILGWEKDQLDELQLLAYAYIRQGKFDIALTFFKALCVLDPDNLYNVQTLGALLLEMDKNEAACEVLEDAREKNPKDPYIALNLAKAWIQTGKKDEALKLAKKLTASKNNLIANNAKALLLAYA